MPYWHDVLGPGEHWDMAESMLHIERVVSWTAGHAMLLAEEAELPVDR